MISEGHFYFDPKDKIYLEHFPGNPVVPGTLIINAFLNLIGEPDVEIENFTYKKFLRPGKCTYQIKKEGKICHCKIIDDNRTIAKGYIKTGDSK